MRNLKHGWKVKDEPNMNYQKSRHDDFPGHIHIQKQKKNLREHIGM